VNINRKTFGKIIVVVAIFILIKGEAYQWSVLLASLFFCVVGVWMLKEQEQRWYKNNWFKGYVSALVLFSLIETYGIFIDLKLDWFVPDDALYVRLYHSQYGGLLSLFLIFIIWFVFTRCYFSEKQNWFARWHLSIWTLLIFIGWNIAILNHYQYVDEDSIHSNGLFSSTTLSLDKVWLMKIDPKIQTIHSTNGNRKLYFLYDLYFVSREGREITFEDMLLTEEDIHAAVMLVNKLEENDREIEVIVRRLNWMSSEMSTILEMKLNQLDDELAALFTETFIDND
jgi:hypothetical protein